MKCSLDFNQTAWSGVAGLDHNRFQAGLEVKTPIKKVDAALNIGYLQVNTPNNSNDFSGVIVGVSIKIPEKKKLKKMRPQTL